MQELELRRVNLLFFKDYTSSPPDRRQIPAAGATYSVFRQGATLSSPASILSSSVVQVNVYDTGHIYNTGDAVQWSQDLSKIFSVSAVDPNRKWLQLTSVDYPLSLAVGDRLIPITFPPILYRDPLAAVALPSNVITLDADGRGSFFCKEWTFDAVLAGAGANRFFPDQAGGLVHPGPWVNVKNYPTFQAAHDDLPSTGGTIFVPAGTYDPNTPTAFGGLHITKSIAILGESRGPWAPMSIINPVFTSSTAILITVGSVLIQNLFIEWPSASQGTARAIRCYRAGPNVKFANLGIVNVVVHNSPNLAFEFICDGHLDDVDNPNGTSYISKLVMVEAVAYEDFDPAHPLQKGGGSLFLGGNGTNNNFFERCEFNGPGFGWYHNVNACYPKRGNTTVAAHGTDTFVGVNIGDEVFGMGIAVGTTVAQTGSGSIVLSQAAVSTFADPPQPGTTLTFYRPALTQPSSDWLPRGHVHLARTLNTRFHHCSFQGPASQPALSTDLVSGDLIMRDTYREKNSPNDAPIVHSFLFNNMSNLLIDGLFHTFANGLPPYAPSRVIMSGPAGVSGKLANAQIASLQQPLTGTDVISLNSASGDDLVLENCTEVSFQGGTRDVVITGVGSLIPLLATLASDVSITLPNGNDMSFRISGTAAIADIVPHRPKRRITLLFESTASLVDGANLKLNGDFIGGADRSISLICSGTSWLEISRSDSITGIRASWLSSTPGQRITAAQLELTTASGAITPTSAILVTTVGTSVKATQLGPISVTPTVSGTNWVFRVMALLLLAEIAPEETIGVFDFTVDPSVIGIGTLPIATRGILSAWLQGAALNGTHQLTGTLYLNYINLS